MADTEHSNNEQSGSRYGKDRDGHSGGNGGGRSGGSYRGRQGLENADVSDQPPYRVYVGNIPYDTVEEDLEQLFEKLAVKKVELVRDRDSGRLRGFAFVEFEDYYSLKDSLEYDEVELKERKLKVAPASSQGGGRRDGGGRGGRGGGRGGRGGYNDGRSGRYGNSYGGSSGRYGGGSGYGGASSRYGEGDQRKGGHGGGGDRRW